MPDPPPDPPPGNREETGAPPRQDGTWLYAVTREPDPAVLAGLTGVAGEPLRTVERAGLAAVAGSVPLSSFGDEALRRNLEDLDWLARVARAHDAVVARLARHGPTVPVRLTTVYLDDERLGTVLRQRAGDFERALARVAGRTEWGVKALLDLGRVREPEQARQGGGSPGTGAGAAYLRRKKTQSVARERTERLAAEQAERVHSALTVLAADACRHRPQGHQLSGDRAPMILNAAYLVDDQATREFKRAVEAQDQEHDAIRLQLTGPWPPYSFASLEERAS